MASTDHGSVPPNDLVRITKPTLAVLGALVDADDFELHGWAIIKATKLGGPTVYKILERLTEAGLLTASWETEHPDGNKPRRRFYRLTSRGAARARALLADRLEPRSARWHPATGTAL